MTIVLSIDDIFGRLQPLTDSFLRVAKGYDDTTSSRLVDQIIYEAMAQVGGSYPPVSDEEMLLIGRVATSLIHQIPRDYQEGKTLQKTRQLLWQMIARAWICVDDADVEAELSQGFGAFSDRYQDERDFLRDTINGALSFRTAESFARAYRLLARPESKVDEARRIAARWLVSNLSSPHLVVMGHLFKGLPIQENPIRLEQTAPFVEAAAKAAVQVINLAYKLVLQLTWGDGLERNMEFEPPAGVCFKWSENPPGNRWNVGQISLFLEEQNLKVKEWQLEHRDLSLNIRLMFCYSDGGSCTKFVE